MTEPVIEALAHSLEAVERGELTPEECLARHPEHSAELAPLLELTRQLRALPAASSRPAFQRTGRQRMLGRLAPRTRWDRLLPAPWAAARPAWVRRPLFTAALLAAVVVFLLGSGLTASASSRALPGDRLYPLKTAVEDVRLTLSGDEGEVELYLQFTRSRLAEIEALVEEERYEDLPTAADRYEAQVQSARQALDRVAARDAAAAAALAVRLQECRCVDETSLRELLETAPEQARPWIEHLLDDESEIEDDETDEDVEDQPTVEPEDGAKTEEGKGEDVEDQPTVEPEGGAETEESEGEDIEDQPTAEPEDGADSGDNSVSHDDDAYGQGQTWDGLSRADGREDVESPDGEQEGPPDQEHGAGDVPADDEHGAGDVPDQASGPAEEPGKGQPGGDDQDRDGRDENSETDDGHTGLVPAPPTGDRHEQPETPDEDREDAGGSPGSDGDGGQESGPGSHPGSDDGGDPHIGDEPDEAPGGTEMGESRS